MSNLIQLLRNSEYTNLRPGKNRNKDRLFIYAVLFMSMMTLYSCSDSGANYSLAWVGPNAGVAFLVVMNARDIQGITDDAANAMIAELLNYCHEWIQ